MEHDPSADGVRTGRPTDDYARAIDLVGRVIAALGSLISSERARPRADMARIAELQAARADAVQTARRLTANDQPGLLAAITEYTRYWTTLNTRRRLTEATPP